MNNGKKVDSSIQPCPIKELKELFVYDSESSGNRHYSRKKCLLEIVQTETTDPVIIHYIGSNPPVTLDVTRDGNPIATLKGEKSEKGGKTYELNAQYYPSKDPYSTAENILMALSTNLADPTVYQIKGLPRTITVKAYNPDQWKLSLALPPIKGMKMGVQMNNSKSAEVRRTKGMIATDTKVDRELKITTESSSWKEATSSELNVKYSSHVKEIATPQLYAYASKEILSIDSKTDSPTAINVGKKLAINLERNACRVDLDLLDIIAGVLSLLLNFTKAVKKFKEYAPTVGWYIDLEFKVLDGKIEGFWGWKETSGYNAYYYYGAAFDVVLFEVMLEIGFGVMVARVGGQVCVQFKGGISVRLGCEVIAPGAKSMALGTVTGVFEAGGYVRMNGGDIIVIEGGINSSITVEGKLSVKLEGGVFVDAENKWDGLAVNLSIQTTMGWKRSKTIQLMDEKSLGTWRYPAEKQEKMLELPKESVSKIIESVVTEGLDLRLFKEHKELKTAFFSRKKYYSKEWDQRTPKQIADIICEPIWKKRNILHLDKKTVQGLAHQVRKKCNVIATKDWSRDWLSEKELEEYLKSAEFKRIIEAAADPAKQYKKELKK